MPLARRKEVISLPLSNSAKLGIKFAALAGVEGRAHKEARREKERGEEEERRLQVERRLQEERRLQKERRLQVEPRLQEGEGTSLQSEEISSLKKQLGHKVTPLLCNAYTLVAAQCPFMISGIVSN